MIVIVDLFYSLELESQEDINSPNWVGLLEYLINLNPEKQYPIGYYTQQYTENLPKVGSKIVEEYHNYAWKNHKNDIFPKKLFEGNYPRSIFLKYQISSYLEQLSEAFVVKDHYKQEELEALMKITPHAIITTNYDLLLEKLFPNHNPIIGQQVIRSRESANYGHLLKIHGCITTPKEIIISSEDYDLFMEKQKYLIAKLLTYFMEYPIIFIGYALNDENIKSILADVSEIIVSDDDEPVSNIWFIDWQQDPISETMKPASDKLIDLNNGKSIRINYLLVNDFTNVYESLHQNINEPVDIIRNLENNIYNIIKSKTVTNLEANLLDFKSIGDMGQLASKLGFESIDGSDNTTKINVVGAGGVTDPEQLVLLYPYSLSDIGKLMGYKGWHSVKKFMGEIKNDTGYDIQQDNNLYHLDREQGSGREANHRYSKLALELFELVRDKSKYEIRDYSGNVLYTGNEL